MKFYLSFLVVLFTIFTALFGSIHETGLSWTCAVGVILLIFFIVRLEESERKSY